MKSALFVVAFLLWLSGFTQVTVNVDAGKVIRTLSGNENGMNLDYLMDGSYLSPSISPTQSVKNVKARLLRYPGGEKSDNYLFSAPPYSSSSPRMALLDTCFWPTNDYKFVDTNSAAKLCWPSALDFDEFIKMCRAVNAEPLVVVAYDASYNKRADCTGKPKKSQLLQNAVEWVRYSNIKKRYDVKYWMIGNESWHDSLYNGTVKPQQYAIDVQEFATAMKAVDPNIRIIANGIKDWWKTILQSSAVSVIDYLGLSEYPVLNYDGGYEYYRTNDVDLTGEVDAAINAINEFAPAPHKARLKVIATEYSSIDWGGKWNNDNNMGHAIANFQMFGDMVIKAALEAACMWNSRWTGNVAMPKSLYDAFDPDGNLNATGTVLNIWGNSLMTTMVNAYDDDTYIRSYASFDSATNRLNILISNKDNSSRHAKINIANYKTDFKGVRWQMSGKSPEDKFPAFLRVDSIFEPADIAEVELPANSISVFRLERDDAAFPARLVRFQAQYQGTVVSLQWQTLNEKSLSEYVIERSEDGKIFMRLESVSAKNEDSASYLYTDSKIHDVPLLYYRLIAVDSTGNESSSRTVSVTINPNVQSIFVQPNPFANALNVKVVSQIEKKISFVLVDISGKKIVSAQHQLFKGDNLLELNNLDRLGSGLYFLKVGDDQLFKIFKVVKK
jgi:alpha-L-arabinofuranosidase